MFQVVFVLFFSILSFGQMISTTKLGDISYQANINEVAAIANLQLIATIEREDNFSELNTDINGIEYQILFYENNVKKVREVFSVSSKDKNLSTLSGIKIGSTLQDLWKNYKKYNIRLFTENVDNIDCRVFRILDFENGSYLDFYLKNNRVVEFKLINNQGYYDNYIYAE